MNVSVNTRDTEWGAVVRMSITDELTIYFSGFDRRDAVRRGRVFKSVYERSNGCEIVEQGTIPTEIACMGNAALASYLFSVHQESTESIGEQLGVSTGTVEQYISDFQNDRR